MIPTQALTVAEFCAAARLGKTKVHELIASGHIRSVKIGYARRIPAAEVDRLLAAGLPATAKGAAKAAAKAPVRAASAMPAFDPTEDYASAAKAARDAAR